MCTLTAAFFTRNDSRVSKSRTRQYVKRGAICTASPDWAGAFAAKRIRFGSCNCACRCVHSPRGDSPKRSLHLRRIRRLWLNSWGGGLNRNPTPGVGRHVLNSSTTAACRICCPFLAFQNQRSLRYRTQGVIMLSRARYCWPGSNYPVTLHDCSAGPPPSAASAAEASLPVPRSTRASFLLGVNPVSGSRRSLSRFAASDLGLSSHNIN